MNNIALGFCFIGNYDLVEPSIKMLVRAVPHLRSWMEIFKIPVNNVTMHRDYSTKTCPGRKFDSEILRDLLK